MLDFWDQDERLQGIANIGVLFQKYAWNQGFEYAINSVILALPAIIAKACQEGQITTDVGLRLLSLLPDAIRAIKPPETSGPKSLE